MATSVGGTNYSWHALEPFPIETPLAEEATGSAQGSKSASIPTRRVGITDDGQHDEGNQRGRQEWHAATIRAAVCKSAGCKLRCIQQSCAAIECQPERSQLQEHWPRHTGPSGWWRWCACARHCRNDRIARADTTAAYTGMGSTDAWSVWIGSGTGAC